MDKGKFSSIPITFQKLENVDDRFMRVKIWLMHLGENLNGSYFSKEVVEKAIPTLANTPILGYIEVNSEGELDFSDHRQVLVVEKGEHKIKYIGQAVGVIGESNDAKFENKVDDDGVERTYLTCTGLLWRKWDDPINIMDRDEIKGQSMELHHDYEGEFKEDGLFHFTKFKFFGACILGKDVLPAMHNATIEKQFSFNEMYQEIQEKVEEYKLLLKSRSSVLDVDTVIDKGGKNMKDKQKEFELSAQQLAQELDSALRKNYEEDEWNHKIYDYYYIDHNDTHVFCQSLKDDWKIVGFEYTLNGNVPVIDYDSKQNYKIEFVPMEGAVLDYALKPNEYVEYELKVKEKELEAKFNKDKDMAVNEVLEELNKLKDQFSILEKEAEELRQFKQATLEAQRQAQEDELFEKFSTILDEEDLKPFKEKAREFELDDLEEKLYALAARKKLKFSADKKKEEKTLKINLTTEVIEETKHDKPYGGLFEKYATNR